MPDPAASKAKDPVLSHGAHEIRNSAAVIIGYLRMLTSERMGTIPDAQRKLFSEMDKSAAKIVRLADEMTELGRLFAGGTIFRPTQVDLGGLIESGIARLEPLPDREVRVSLRNEAPGATIKADPDKLRQAINAVISAHRRELVTSNELCVLVHRTSREDRPVLQVTLGGADRLEVLREADPSTLVTFESVRGGVGLSLFIADQILAAQGAQLWSVVTLDEPLPPLESLGAQIESPPERVPVRNTKAAAVLFFPEA